MSVIFLFDQGIIVGWIEREEGGSVGEFCWVGEGAGPGRVSGDAGLYIV